MKFNVGDVVKCIDPFLGLPLGNYKVIHIERRGFLYVKGIGIENLSGGWRKERFIPASTSSKLNRKLLL